MRRFLRHPHPSSRTDVTDARDLVDLASRMGIPPEDAARQVAQLINDANRPEPSDRFNLPVAPRF
jgi:hypothetical protein